MSDIPMKLCTGPCGQEYPATAKYWYKHASGKYGLDPKCKKCKNAKQKDYQMRPEAKERRRSYRSQSKCQERERTYQVAYRNRPENRERKRANTKVNGKIYRSRPEVKERRRTYDHTRRARKQSVAGTYTAGQIQDQLKRQKHKCYYCQKRLQKVKGKHVYHVEHTFPLSRVAGTDVPANSIDYLVLACHTCNLSKHDKFPWEWPEGGRLL